MALSEKLSPALNQFPLFVIHPNKDLDIKSKLL